MVLRPQARARLGALLAALALAGCGGDDTTGPGGNGGSGGDGGTGGSTGGPTPQDVLTTHIALDLAALTGTAKVTVQPASDGSPVSLEVAGLALTSLSVDGTLAEPAVTGGLLAVPVADPSKPVTVDISYSFEARPATSFDGWMPDSGVTFLWTTFCDNLFPCVSDPQDGAVFTMAVTGVDPSLTAVFPETTTGQAPSYMPAVAVGDYVKKDLGTTKSGTAVSVWHFPGQEADAAAGTAHLADVVGFFEDTYGPYPFGKEIGSVAANWGEGAYGGMEHHPYFHVATDAMSDEETHAHEAAHGWFGDGVRIACWEDFVLSEGTATYLAAHALERVGGPNLWPGYVSILDGICSGADINTVALPETCGEIDLITDDLWSSVPYQKGACFLEDAGDLIGTGALDEALADFFQARAGQAARMRDLVDAIKSKAGDAKKAQIDVLVTEWLLTKECPADYAERCGAHQP
jgi:aminopeptidase N